MLGRIGSIPTVQNKLSSKALTREEIQSLGRQTQSLRETPNVGELYTQIKSKGNTPQDIYNAGERLYDWGCSNFTGGIARDTGKQLQSTALKAIALTPIQTDSGIKPITDRELINRVEVKTGESGVMPNVAEIYTRLRQGNGLPNQEIYNKGQMLYNRGCSNFIGGIARDTGKLLKETASSAIPFEN